MANSTQPSQSQPPHTGLRALFDAKTQRANDVLKTIGKSLGKPSTMNVDPSTGRRKIVFAEGEITEKTDNAKSIADLSVSYTPFSSFINRDGHQWLGNIKEDFYQTSNGAGKSIVVQQYENGVIWWDGQNGFNVISWVDWRAIAGNNNTQKHVSPVFQPTLFWYDKVALWIGKAVIILILCSLAFLLLYARFAA